MRWRLGSATTAAVHLGKSPKVCQRLCESPWVSFRSFPLRQTVHTLEVARHRAHQVPVILAHHQSSALRSLYRIRRSNRRGSPLNAAGLRERIDSDQLAAYSLAHCAMIHGPGLDPPGRHSAAYRSPSDKATTIFTRTARWPRALQARTL